MTPTDIRDTAIPEDVLEAAEKAYSDAVRDVGSRIQIIARAIMAATEVERERCAREAQDKIDNLMEALKRIQRLSDRCEVLPDTDGLRRAYRDIDVAARVAIAKAEGARHD